MVTFWSIPTNKKFLSFQVDDLKFLNEVGISPIKVCLWIYLKLRKFHGLFIFAGVNDGLSWYLWGIHNLLFYVAHLTCRSTIILDNQDRVDHLKMSNSKLVWIWHLFIHSCHVHLGSFLGCTSLIRSCCRNGVCPWFFACRFASW